MRISASSMDFAKDSEFSTPGGPRGFLEAPNASARFIENRFADDASLDFARKNVLRSTAAVAMARGFAKTDQGALLKLSDLFERYVKMLLGNSKRYAEEENRSTIDLKDTLRVFEDKQVDRDDFLGYVQFCPEPSIPNSIIPAFPVAPEYVEGVATPIPPRFFDDVPCKEDYEKEGQERFMNWLDLHLNLGKERLASPEKPPQDPKPTMQSNPEIAEKKKFPNFKNMKVRDLGFFNPKHPEVPKVDKLPLVLERPKSPEPLSSAIRVVHSSNERDSKVLANTMTESSMEERQDEEDEEEEEERGYYRRRLPNVPPPRRYRSMAPQRSLESNVLCMISHEVSPWTNQDNIRIRINRRLMEHEVLKAEKRSAEVILERATMKRHASFGRKGKKIKLEL
ncbi:hypothetical protein L596_015900 [Steinernema carpocapsae]|uniref:Bromodomain associated domain-containing protein n=1 Tax=Steinernema carpocapsae TaxID=34508 RepID=A0A4U5NGE2_STECR|nr:hypothetical protein L596_015900 [Steinernema carpocapsae]